MRRMSFALTTPQIRDRSKTVTRRTGWAFLKPGDRLAAVEKAMGFKKGEKAPAPIAVIEVVSVDRQRLCDITPQDVFREGFPSFTTPQFIAFYKRANGGLRDQPVTRIEFRYVDAEVR